MYFMLISLVNLVAPDIESPRPSLHCQLDKAILRVVSAIGKQFLFVIAMLMLMISPSHPIFWFTRR